MKILKTILWWVLAASLVGYGVFVIATAPKIPEENLISKDGLHVHTHLSIKIKGVSYKVPTNIGVNGVMGAGGDPMELHTHGTDGIIHAEFAGFVTKDQLKIGNFFKVWEKDFSKDSILGNKTGPDGKVRMFVNGVENFDFENYEMTGKGTYKVGAGDEGLDEILITFE